MRQNETIFYPPNHWLLYWSKSRMRDGFNIRGEFSWLGYSLRTLLPLQKIVKFAILTIYDFYSSIKWEQMIIIAFGPTDIIETCLKQIQNSIWRLILVSYKYGTFKWLTKHWKCDFNVISLSKVNGLLVPSINYFNSSAAFPTLEL